MVCDKCNKKEHDMIFDFTHSGKNPNGKIEHICFDCFNNFKWRVDNA